MLNTGRLRKPLIGAARRIVFERNIPEQIRCELPFICKVDRAHATMLAEQSLVKPEVAARLLWAIATLEDRNFLPLFNRPCLRGLYLLYEDYLIETAGAEVGGILQTARSRNDLGAAVLKLRLRDPYLQVLQESLRLQAVLLRQAKQYSSTAMPLYTNGQPAVPGTYGHYLGGVAEAISRDIDGMFAAGKELETSPLGAGAVAGSMLPIDCARTAGLLGFESPVMNSVDAVASRDLVARLLAAMSVYAATLGRLATDLMQCFSNDRRFLDLPDELVGSSSQLPQKRNPFLLEHLQALVAPVTGAFVAALTAVHSVPFTNSSAVGTDSVRPVWSALEQVRDGSLLARLIVRHAKPNAERMLEAANSNFLNASALATRLVTGSTLDFRTAHRWVGEIVSSAERSGQPLIAVAAEVLRAQGAEITLDDLDAESIVDSSVYGGGPAPGAMLRRLDSLEQQWSSRRRQKAELSRKWSEADNNLQIAVEAILTAECTAQM